jgi:magnesium-transporting ATPase (P-type)
VGSVISLITTFLVFVVVWRLVVKVKASKEISKGLSAILRDKYGYASLTNFQFLVWTIVFLFSILLVYMVRIQSDVLAYVPSYPTAAMALMGVSTVSAIASKAISQKRGPPPAEPQSRPRSLWLMLCEESEDPKELEPSLARVQMFIWTIVSVLIYIYALIMLFLAPFLAPTYFKLIVPNILPSACNLTIPDIDPSLVTLMGLSQTAYIGKKYFAPKQDATLSPPAGGGAGFCKYCGKPLGTGALFCPECGKSQA